MFNSTINFPFGKQLFGDIQSVAAKDFWHFMCTWMKQVTCNDWSVNYHDGSLHTQHRWALCGWFTEEPVAWRSTFNNVCGCLSVSWEWLYKVKYILVFLVYRRVYWFSYIWQYLRPRFGLSFTCTFTFPLKKELQLCWDLISFGQTNHTFVSFTAVIEHDVVRQAGMVL